MVGVGWMSPVMALLSWTTLWAVSVGFVGSLALKNNNLRVCCSEYMVPGGRFRLASLEPFTLILIHYLKWNGVATGLVRG